MQKKHISQAQLKRETQTCDHLNVSNQPNKSKPCFHMISEDPKFGILASKRKFDSSRKLNESPY